MVLRMPKGKEAVDYYVKKGELNDLARKGLISAIVEYYLAADIQIKINDFGLIADEIIRRFPNELKVKKKSVDFGLIRGFYFNYIFSLGQILCAGI